MPKPVNPFFQFLRSLEESSPQYKGRVGAPLLCASCMYRLESRSTLRSLTPGSAITKQFWTFH